MAESPAQKTRVAVIGVGSLGAHHARIYSQHPLVELVAAVDVREERAREAAERYQCLALTDFAEVRDRIDAASLAVPTELHAEVGVQLLEWGTHLLVEKPIASTAAQADDLIEAARRNQRVLHVGHSERFNPAMVAVQPLVTQPQFFETHRMGVFVPRSLDIDVVLDLMIHDLDLILKLVGCPIREIRAVGIPVLTPKVDIANARLEFENGCVANITASRVSAERIRKLRFFQPHDYVSIDFQNRDVEIFSLVSEEAGPGIRQRRLEIEEKEPLLLEIEAFLGAQREGRAGGCSGPEARKALTLALEINNRILQRRQEIGGQGN